VEVRSDPEGYDRLFVSAPELDAEFEVFGACPVQALGAIRGRDLYFRARHGAWWFEVADGSGTLPSDGGREPDGFYRDGVDPHYGRMPLPEAVTVIVECLREYAGGPGQSSSWT
jgi:hypothetical protein